MPGKVKVDESEGEDTPRLPATQHLATSGGLLTSLDDEACEDSVPKLMTHRAGPGAELHAEDID